MPQIFGSEVSPRTLWIVLGIIGAGVAVVVYVRSRSAGAVAPSLGPGEFAGGGGGGIPVSAPSNAAADNYNARLQDVQVRAAEFALRQGEVEAGQQKAQFDLALSLNKAYTQMQLALFGQQTEVGAVRAETEKAAQRVVQRSISGRQRVQCPPGEHFVVLADGSTACQPRGGAGFSFRTITSGIADIVSGVFRGAAEAAPGVGYGAAQYYGVKALSARQPTAPTPAPYTPGVRLI